MRSPLRWWGWLAVITLMAGLWYWNSARSRLLEDVVVTRSGEDIVVDLRFNGAVSYQSHFPSERGPVLQIALKPSWWYRYASDVNLDRADIHQSFAGEPALVQAVFEGGVPGGPLVSLRFARTQRFQVLPGQDARGLQVRLYNSALAAQ